MKEPTKPNINHAHDDKSSIYSDYDTSSGWEGDDRIISKDDKIQPTAKQEEQNIEVDLDEKVDAEDEASKKTSGKKRT